MERVLHNRLASSFATSMSNTLKPLFALVPPLSGAHPGSACATADSASGSPVVSKRVDGGRQRGLVRLPQNRHMRFFMPVQSGCRCGPARGTRVV
jgi:hypothetical protein